MRATQGAHLILFAEEPNGGHEKKYTEGEHHHHVDRDRMESHGIQECLRDAPSERNLAHWIYAVGYRIDIRQRFHPNRHTGEREEGPREEKHGQHDEIHDDLEAFHGALSCCHKYAQCTHHACKQQHQ